MIDIFQINTGIYLDTIEIPKNISIVPAALLYVYFIIIFPQTKNLYII